MAASRSARPKPQVERPRLRILMGAGGAMGPGRAALLDAIARTGSISAAARQMGMSYRRAWTLVDSTNQAFRAPLVEAVAGGRGGGGARVTEAGLDVLRRYRAMEEKAAASVKSDAEAFFRLMVPERGAL